MSHKNNIKRLELEKDNIKRCISYINDPDLSLNKKLDMILFTVKDLMVEQYYIDLSIKKLINKLKLDISENKFKEAYEKLIQCNNLVFILDKNEIEHLNLNKIKNTNILEVILKKDSLSENQKRILMYIKKLKDGILSFESDHLNLYKEILEERLITIEKNIDNEIFEKHHGHIIDSLKSFPWVGFSFIPTGIGIVILYFYIKELGFTELFIENVSFYFLTLGWLTVFFYFIMLFFEILISFFFYKHLVKGDNIGFGCFIVTTLVISLLAIIIVYIKTQTNYYSLFILFSFVFPFNSIIFLVIILPNPNENIKIIMLSIAATIIIASFTLSSDKNYLKITNIQMELIGVRDSEYLKYEIDENKVYCSKVLFRGNNKYIYIIKNEVPKVNHIINKSKIALYEGKKSPC